MKTKGFKLFGLLIVAMFAFSSCDKCKDVDCGEGGSCNDETGECVCEDGYSGTKCETYDACHDVTCENGDCVDGTCDCPPGYSGESCETYDVCHDNDCGGNGTCSEVDGKATCTCNDGYSGENCETEWVTAFIKQWDGTNTCKGTGTQYSYTIAQGSDNLSLVITGSDKTLNATITEEGKFEIPTQNAKEGGTNYEFTGSGEILNTGQIQVNTTRVPLSGTVLKFSCEFISAL